jgi:hypothetical protein
MPRIDPTVTKEAEAIYKSWPQGERGQKVSQAIIDYDQKGTVTRQEFEELKREVREGRK